MEELKEIEDKQDTRASSDNLVYFSILLQSPIQLCLLQVKDWYDLFLKTICDFLKVFIDGISIKRLCIGVMLQYRELKGSEWLGLDKVNQLIEEKLLEPEVRSFPCV